MLAVVREGQANAARHADGARATDTVQLTDATLEVLVGDTWRVPAPGR